MSGGKPVLAAVQSVPLSVERETGGVTSPSTELPSAAKRFVPITANDVMPPLPYGPFVGTHWPNAFGAAPNVRERIEAKRMSFVFMFVMD